MKGLLASILVLALSVTLGVASHVRLPEGAEGFYLYPMGLVLVALHFVHGHWRAAMAAVAFAVTALTLHGIDCSPAAALLYTAACLLAGVVALRFLPDGDGLPSIRTENDWLRVVLASLLGALLFASAGALAGTIDDSPERGTLVVAGLVNGFASMLVWLPLAMLPRGHQALAGSTERLLQWALLLAGTLAVFMDAGRPSFSYAVLALLAWGGLRLSLLETLLQIIAVRLIATSFHAHGLGPFAPGPNGVDLPPDLNILHTQLFLISCSLCVVALSLSSRRARVQAHIEATAHAEGKAAHRLNTVVEELEAERVALEEMREVDKVKDVLVSTVSHELRTPITNIIGYSEMLEDGDYGNLSEEQTQAMAKIEDNSRRLLGLIDDLLTLSRMRSAQLEITAEPTDLVGVVRRAEEAILPRLNGSRLSLEVDLPRSPLVVEADGEKIERVLVNLMSNAVKFTPAQGRIAVRLTSERSWAILEVSDTGYGIAPDDLDRLFSQFFRTSVAEERHIQGTGLGLSIVRSIVEAHGGQVEVSSTVDVGTTFRVYLPR